MGSAFHQLCPRYSGTLTPTAPTAISYGTPLPLPFKHCARLGDVIWDNCTLYEKQELNKIQNETAQEPLDSFLFLSYYTLLRFHKNDSKYLGHFSCQLK